MVVPAEVPASPDVIERARRLGPLPWSALGRRPAPTLPSAEELALWTATALDEIWYLEDRPDPFTYVEVGAGDGRRARELLGLGPDCLEALRIVLVDDDPALRERQAEQLSIEAPELTLGPVVASDDPDEGSRPLPGIGPLVTSLIDLPVLASASFTVVAAYGWLSSQPCDRYLWRDGAWWEIRLGVIPPADDVVTELPLPLEADKAEAIDHLARDRFDGARYSVPVGAVAWLRNALGSAEAGRLLAVDRWTLRSEPLGDDPAPVPLDQLAVVRRPVDGPIPALGSLEVVRWRLG